MHVEAPVANGRGSNRRWHQGAKPSLQSQVGKDVTTARRNRFCAFLRQQKSFSRVLLQKCMANWLRELECQRPPAQPAVPPDRA
jgi:hypothetical protein